MGIHSHFQFAPLDTSAAVDKFLGYWNPDAVFLIESELWPNLIFSSAEKGVSGHLILLLFHGTFPFSFESTLMLTTTRG